MRRNTAYSIKDLLKITCAMGFQESGRPLFTYPHKGSIILGYNESSSPYGYRFNIFYEDGIWKYGCQWNWRYFMQTKAFPWVMQSLEAFL